MLKVVISPTAIFRMDVAQGDCYSLYSKYSPEHTIYKNMGYDANKNVYLSEIQLPLDRKGKKSSNGNGNDKVYLTTLRETVERANSQPLLSFEDVKVLKPCNQLERRLIEDLKIHLSGGIKNQIAAVTDREIEHITSVFNAMGSTGTVKKDIEFILNLHIKYHS